MLIFWVITPCGLVGRHQRLGGTYCMFLRNIRIYLDVGMRLRSVRAPQVWYESCLLRPVCIPQVALWCLFECFSWSSVSEQYLTDLSMSVSFFRGSRQPAWSDVVVTYCYAWMGTEDIVGTHCCNNKPRPLLEHGCNNGHRGHCWDTMLQQWDRVIVGSKQWPRITLSTMTLDTIVVFVIPFEEEWSKPTVSLSRGYQRRHRPCCGVWNTFGVS
jgi:hypothetical protein